MKELCRSALIALSLFGWSVLPAAEPKPAPPHAGGNSGAKPLIAGQYVGKWKSTGDASGELRLMLKQDGAGTWIAEASFTYEGATIPTKMKSVEAEGSKVRLVFDWDSRGTPAQSTITGELTGDTLQGTFESTSGSNSSKGTWTVARS